MQGMKLSPKDSFHRRPLPDDLVAFASPQGRVLLREALMAGDAEAFFPLVAHLHTQAEPAWCGIGTLVTVLNALEIDPGRVWKGPWRFFGEELLICCKSLELAAAEGLTLAEVACLAQCNGAQVQMVRAEPDGLAAFRAALLASLRAPAGPFVVVNYDRAALGQTGSGHFSPLAAWHQASDQVLILDVARFKYPPHWVPLSRLWTAMQGLDGATAQPRGYLLMERAGETMVRPAGLEQLLNRLHAVGAGQCLTPPAA
jgi:glutathione gamma-glutamylcysteinyltransferase